ncbi:MAG TPA: DUF992 domain-containing protein [Mesorhizobium sp.]|jgi:hypothetical protein|nr:DUF992 domain-containing protein [Mesorhizobium sp.]
MIKRWLAAAALAGAALFATSAQSGNLQLGLLDCEIGGGTGLVVASNKPVTCTFRPSDESFARESYSGVLSKFGVDLGVTNQGTLTWAVLAAGWDTYDPGALAGAYVGAGAEATVVTGGGANLLVGGSGRAFVLQPLSVQAQTGLNVSLGVAALELYHSLK